MVATLQIISGSKLRDTKATTNDYPAFGSVTSYHSRMQQIMKVLFSYFMLATYYEI